MILLLLLMYMKYGIWFGALCVFVLHLSQTLNLLAIHEQVGGFKKYENFTNFWPNNQIA